MDRAVPAASAPRPVLLAVIGSAALLAGVMFGATALDEAHALPWRTLALASLATLLAGAALAVWLALRNRQLGLELRAARVQAQALDDMLDLWQWRTDGQHRLTALRPPRGSAAAGWTTPAIGRPLWDIFRADDAAVLHAQLDRHAPIDDVEVRRDGTAEHTQDRASLRARVCLDDCGAFAGYCGTLRELPAVVPGETSVQPPAAPSQGESDAESFGYTVSHDLRAPIRVVEGFTKILKEDYGRALDRVGNDHLDRVLGAAARMNAMIDALLALSKLSSQPLARQPVNLSQLAAYVADDLRRQGPERQVQLTVQPGLQVVGDPTLLRMVIENLLGNAWKYTSKSSEAQIRFERHAQRPDTFTVRDNGAGFDMRFADRLFGVFQRLHSASDFPGTGVGLASVRRIVRRHGGEIWAEAEVAHGASFHFSLPQR